MTNCLKVVFTITAGLLIVSILYHPTEAMQTKPLIFAWILKPPYATPPSNGSSDSKAHGMIREALLRHIQGECGWFHAFVKTNWELDTLKVDSEFGMIELLRQNKVHVAVPIFENPTNRRYSKFPYFKLDDYPGSEYITTVDDTSTLTVALDAVIKAWPLLAVTIVLTAIAGIIMWALVGIWLCAIYCGFENLFNQMCQTIEIGAKPIGSSKCCLTQ